MRTAMMVTKMRRDDDGNDMMGMMMVSRRRRRRMQSAPEACQYLISPLSPRYTGHDEDGQTISHTALPRRSTSDQPQRAIDERQQCQSFVTCSM